MRCLARLQIFWYCPGQCRYTSDGVSLFCLNVWYYNNNSYSLLHLLWTNLQQVQDAHHLHFVNSRAKQETNMWSSSIKESRNGTWSVNIRVSILWHCLIENAELLKIRRSYVKIALIKVRHVYHFYNNQTNYMDYRVSWHCSPELNVNFSWML